MTHKGSVASTNNGILFSPQEEGNSTATGSMGKPRGHCAKWNEPVTENKRCIVPGTCSIWKITTFRDSKRGMVAVYQEVGRQGNGQKVSPKQDEQTTDIGPRVNTNFLNAYMSVNTDNLISRVLTTIKTSHLHGKNNITHITERARSKTAYQGYGAFASW